MVKVQKPSPKTFQKDPKKANKPNGVKKEKPVKNTKDIPATNVKAKKAKTQLIAEEKPVPTIKPTNIVEKVKNNKKPAFVAQEVNEKKANKQKKPVHEQKQIDNAANKKPPPAKNTSAPKKVGPLLAKEPKKNLTPPQLLAKTDKKNSKPLKEQKKTVPPTQVQTKNEQKKKPNADDKKPLSKKQKKNASQAEKAKQKKEKKVVAPVEQFEQQPFDEEQFNTVVNEENIKKIGKALKSLVENEVNEKKTSIFSDYRYFLNVCSYKIPNCPKRIVKMNLKHSLVDVSEDDVVFIVSDLQRGAKVDYEPTIQHYEDLLREAGVTGLKVVPFNQLRNECTTFETKRKFANTYDYFLCDGRIVGHVVGFCGNHFQKPRTTLHSVKMDNPKNHKNAILHALKRTSYKQLQKGDLISIPVGNHRFSVNDLAENVQIVIDQLKTIYPGGLGNIRSMHLKIDIKGTSSIPLYVNLGGAPEETPNVIGLREQRMLKLKREANEVLSKFNLSKTGEFVKLDKIQEERKRHIQEARKALLSDPVVVDETEGVPAKKSKKNVEKEENEDSNAEDDESDDDDAEGNDNSDEDEEEDGSDDEEEEEDE